MAAQCDVCGAKTELKGVFQTSRRAFRLKSETLCPTCASRRFLIINKWIYALYVAVAGIVAGLVWNNPDPPGWITLNLMLFQPIVILCIVPHELAHACVARVLGWDVYSITIGRGKILSKKKLFGVELILRTLPVLGLTVVAPPEAKYSRIRHGAIVAAGPVMNLLLLAVGWWIAPSTGIGIFDQVHQQVAVGPVLMIANFILLVGNLWPRPIKTDAGITNNDGLTLFKIFRMSATEQERWEVLFALATISKLQADRDYELAYRRCKRTLEKFPENELVLNWLGLILIHLCRDVEARDIFVRMLDKPSENKLMPWVLMNNIAYLDIVLSDPLLLPEADRYSKEACDNLSWLAFAKGTRGAVLVEMGEVEQGIALLKQALADNEDVTSKAANLCHLAIAETKRGNTEQASQHLKAARALDPTCHLLKDARIMGLSVS